MAEHKECKHYDGCYYRNDIGTCPNWCAQFKHKDDVRVVRCKDCKFYMTIHCICDGCCISDDWYCAGGERRTDEALQ